VPFLGTDLVRVARLSSVRTPAFTRRTFTAREVQVCRDRPDSLAGRWAVKEAVLKALGVGIAGIPLTDIETDRGPDGEPLLTLRGAALERAQELGIQQWAVSISHDGEYAMAVVIGS
jgi:holo-[acyl-carrier protein] synthase